MTHVCRLCAGHPTEQGASSYDVWSPPECDRANRRTHIQCQ